jgi:hypothetical protein
VIYYDVYRTASSGTPASTGYIGSVNAATSFDDTGIEGFFGTSVPVTNTTSGIQSTHGFTNGSYPAIIASSTQGNFTNGVGLDIQLHGQFIGVSTLQPTFVINSETPSVNFGQMGNSASGQWFLGYSPTSTTNGTSVLTWDDTNKVTLPIGPLNFTSLAGGLSFKSGSNGRVGTGTLVAGTLTVGNTSVTANTKILLTSDGGGVNIGALYVLSQTATTGFVVNSTNAADTASFHYLLYEVV